MYYFYIFLKLVRIKIEVVIITVRQFIFHSVSHSEQISYFCK